MKLKSALFVFIILQVFTAPAQEVPRKVVIEHFTNTLCSTCASRNPGFFTNYNNENNGNMIHLSVHPSSPYAACVFNQHDKLANDGRAQFYSVFGSTPRLVINGSVISTSTSFNNASLFNPFIGQTSPISLQVRQQKFGSDSIRVQVVVKTKANHALGNQRLYVALAEDTIFYAAPNGEDEHYNVMRAPLFGNEGIALTLPTIVGDSLVFTKTVSARADWNFNRIYPLAILQNESDKAVTQAEAVSPTQNTTVVLSVSVPTEVAEFMVFPNPTTQYFTVKTSQTGSSRLSVLGIDGTQVHQCEFSTEIEIDLSRYPEGVYFVTVENAVGTYTKKIVKSAF